MACTKIMITDVVDALWILTKMPVGESLYFPKDQPSSKHHIRFDKVYDDQIQISWEPCDWDSDEHTLESAASFLYDQRDCFNNAFREELIIVK